MKRITVEEFMNQWPPQLSSTFEKNIFDFVTVAGDYSRRFFATSFPFQGFPKSGKPWAPRRSKKKKHPILIETGELRGKIEKSATQIHRDKKRKADGTFFSKFGSTYEIWTGEGLFIDGRNNGKRKRGQNTKGYAAIHNTDPKLHNFRVNQYSSRKPVQRQFIGFSPVLTAKYNELLPMIFKGFPHA